MAIYQGHFPPASGATSLSIPAPVPVLADDRDQLLAKMLYLHSGGRGFVVKTAGAPPPYNGLNGLERCFAFIVMSASARLTNVEGDDDTGFVIDGINDQDLICGTYPGMRLKQALVVDGKVGFYLM